MRNLRGVILTLMLALPAAGAPAEEPRPPDALLTGLGLSAEKTRYVFADAEAGLRQKYQDAVAARERAMLAEAEAEKGPLIEQGILELQAGEQQLREEIAAMRSASSGMGYGRGRAARYYRNQSEAAAREGQKSVEQVRKQIAQAKKQKPDAKRQQAAEAGARLAYQAAEQAVRDLNEAYDDLVRRYEEARARPGVLEALEAAGRPKKLGYRLGPSEESDKIGKWAKGLLKIRSKRPTSSARSPAGTAGLGGLGSTSGDGKRRP